MLSRQYYILFLNTLVSQLSEFKILICKLRKRGLEHFLLYLSSFYNNIFLPIVYFFFLTLGFSSFKKHLLIHKPNYFLTYKN